MPIDTGVIDVKTTFRIAVGRQFGKNSVGGPAWSVLIALYVPNGVRYGSI